MKNTLIIIPAFNEGKGIATLVKSVHAVMQATADVVVIDDGSSDDTASQALNAEAVLLRHPFNMGYGSTIQTGYKYAAAGSYEYIVQIDGDGQHDASYIPALLQPVVNGSADLAIGSRFLEKTSYCPPLARRVAIGFFRKLVSIVTGQRITDPTSGFQAFNRSLLGFFTSDAFPTDYPDADVLLVLGLAGFRITEVPVRMYANSEGRSMHSGLKPVYYVFKMLLSIMVTLMRKKIKYPGAKGHSDAC